MWESLTYLLYVDYYILAFDFILIVGSFIFLRKLETIKFDQQNDGNFIDFIQVAVFGLIFSLILAFLFGFIK